MKQQIIWRLWLVVVESGIVESCLFTPVHVFRQAAKQKKTGFIGAARKKLKPQGVNKMFLANTVLRYARVVFCFHPCTLALTPTAGAQHRTTQCPTG